MAREQAQRKTRSVHRLRHERDGCIRELEAKCEQHRVSLENLAKAEENLSSAQADVNIAKVEAESAKEALSWMVEDFCGSNEYREELLESGFASYRVGYEDARDAIQRLYPELDLSSVIPLGSEDRAVEEEADPIPEGQDRKSTRLNSSHSGESRMPSSA